jgi:hypothetical protein
MIGNVSALDYNCVVIDTEELKRVRIRLSPAGGDMDLQQPGYQFLQQVE